MKLTAHLGPVEPPPIQFRCRECSRVAGVRNPVARFRCRERSEMRELSAPPFVGEIGGLACPVGKEQKGCLGRSLLSHEQHRNMWTEKQQNHGLLELLATDELRETFAQRPVTHLIVVLREEDGGLRRKVGAPFAPRSVVQRKRFALIGKSFRERPSQMLERPVRERTVISLVFTREQDVQGVVEIISHCAS